MRGSAAIWRALAEAWRQHLSDQGAPPPTVAEAGLTRRRLVASLAAAAGVQALPGAVHAAGPRPVVAIVGGGLAGLIALDTLVRAGIDAHLYEARGRLGGRIRTTVGTLGEGLAVDDGGQLVNSDHADMRALCKRFGLTLVDRHRGPSRAIMLGADGPIPNADWVRALRPLAARIATDAARADRDPRAAATIDRLSAGAYLDHAGAKGVARTLLESGIRTEYGVEPAQASARELLWNLPSIDGERIDVLGDSDERYAIAGGSQRLTDALARAHAARIQTGRTLIRIGREGLRIGLHMADGAVVEADRVIVAVPAGLYRAIRFDLPMPPVWRSFLAEIAPGRVEKLIVGYRRRPWLQAFGPAGQLWSGPGFAEAWDATCGQPELMAGALTFFLGGGQVDAFERAQAETLAQAWTAAAGRAVPGLAGVRNGHVRRTGWARDPFARGGYVNYAPGQLSRFAALLWNPKPGALTGRVGPLFFAGEHLSDAFPGYMNGAAETGRRAAETIIAEAGRSAAA